jgi:hypothetical protein
LLHIDIHNFLLGLLEYEPRLKVLACVEFIHSQGPVISFAQRSFNDLSREAGKEI